MRQKSGPEKQPAEDAIRDIRRATRRHFSAEEKIRFLTADTRLNVSAISNAGSREANPAPMRSDALGREQTTARILLHGPIAGRLRFQPSRPAPSLPHQAPNERGENAGTPRASTPRRASRP